MVDGPNAVEGGEPPEGVREDEGQSDGDATDAGDGTVVGLTGGVGVIDQAEALRGDANEGVRMMERRRLARARKSREYMGKS